MIIDFHCHTFPEKIAESAITKLSRAAHITPYTNGTTAGLMASMENGGVDLSVMLPVAVKHSNVPGMNNYAADFNEQHGGKGIISFGAMHPDYPDWREELGRIASLGFKGIKIHPVYQGVDQDDIRYLRILERAGELDLIVVAHAGLDVGFPGVDRTNPDMILNAISQVGPVKFVAAHMGSWKAWDRVDKLLDKPNIYIDTAFSLGRVTPLAGDAYHSSEDLELLSNTSFCQIVRKFGAQRVLFGSDTPWDDQGGAIEKLKASGLNEEELEQIFCSNARKLLSI